jgi:hypothetical protein
LTAAALGATATALAVLGTASRAPAADTPSTQVKILAASIGGHSLFGTSTERPVPMEPRGDIPLSITMRNTGETPVAIRYIRITGAMLGIRFVRFEATSRLVLPAGEIRTISQPGDFFDIDQSSTGYINSAIQVVNVQRVTLASHSFVADVHGKFWSSEGIFLLEVIIFSLIGLARILVGVMRRSLPVNRFLRGILFGITTGGAAIAIVVGIAMLRIGLAAPTTWIPATLLALAGGFALGYISPGPLDRRAHEDAEAKVVDLVAAEAVARASGEHQRRTTGQTVSHSSGEHAATEQQSGGFAPAHESGGFVPQHESGEFDPQKHDSAPIDPVS